MPNGYCRGSRASSKWDGYAGYNRLIAPDRVGPDIKLSYCWAHARRKLVEITRTGSAPIAEEGVKRIGELYRIEAELRGLFPEARLAGSQERSAPLIADRRTWLTHHRARVAGKSPLGEAFAYIAKSWDGLCIFLTDGRVEIDNSGINTPRKDAPVYQMDVGVLKLGMPVFRVLRYEVFFDGRRVVGKGALSRCEDGERGRSSEQGQKHHRCGPYA
jgi:hypothetical protein